tara:strand:- start:152 stop:472 length:321 start_codon:yes stop_codon:yes gene_type:complete
MTWSFKVPEMKARASCHDDCMWKELYMEQCKLVDELHEESMRVYVSTRDMHWIKDMFDEMTNRIEYQNDKAIDELNHVTNTIRNKEYFGNETPKKINQSRRYNLGS